MSNPPPLPFFRKFRPKPIGCIFCLTCKFTCKPFPNDYPILDLDPYDVKQLADIFSSLDRKDAVYLFTKLPTRTTKGFNRHVGNGIWRSDDKIPDKIFDYEGKHVGMSRRFTYLEKSSKYHCQILMTEYTLIYLDYDPSKDYVFCVISKKKGRRRMPSNNKYQSRSALVQQPKPNDALFPVKLEPSDDPLVAVKSEPSDDPLVAVKLEPDDEFSTAQPMDYESESRTPSLPQLMLKMTKIKF